MIVKLNEENARKFVVVLTPSTGVWEEYKHFDVQLITTTAYVAHNLCVQNM